MSVDVQEKQKAGEAVGTGSGVVPCTVVKNAREAAKFYEKAFGGEVQQLTPAMDDPDLIIHCHIKINGGSLIFNDAFPKHGFPYQDPQGYVLHLQVDDPQAWWKRAVDAGCTVTMPLDVQFWGDRYGQVKDPFDVTWSIGGKA